MTTPSRAAPRRPRGAGPGASFTLWMSSSVADGVRDHAEDSYPREACGFLLGRDRGADMVVERLVRADNRAARPDRFYIDATDVFAAMQAARRAGGELVGVYHSHPDAAAKPSETDRNEAWVEGAHMIVSCRSGVAAEIGCWRWDGGVFSPIGLRVER